MSESDSTLPSTGIKIIKKSYAKDRALSASSIPESSSTKINPDTVVPEETVPVSKTKEETMTLTKQQKEDLIEKLETKKHKLKLAYREAPDPEIHRQYQELRELLAIVKECDAVDKIQDNIKDVNAVHDEFHKKFKKLAISDFSRIIDLTGSKDGRKPDITTQTWLQSKTVFKDKVYRPAPEEKLEKFTQKMKLKTMPTELQHKLESNIQGNLQTVNTHKQNPDIFKYKKYNPLDYQGLSTY